MEQFQEKKSVIICQNICMFSMIGFLLSMFLAIFWHMFLLGMLLIPTAIPFLIYATIVSKKDEYTRNFLELMRKCLSEATTLEQLKDIKTDFFQYAIKDGTYCLSFPGSLKKIHNEINYKIEILEKQNK